MTQRITDERLAEITACEHYTKVYTGVPFDEAIKLAADLRDERAKVAECIEALRPFAKDAEGWADSVPDDYKSKCFEPGAKSAHDGSETEFTVGDLRHARALLTKLSGDGR